MGSVKELVDITKPTHNSAGEGYFVFGDGFSVFDYGHIEDVPRKSEALCLFGAKTFELVEGEGIQTHYLGLMNENDDTVGLDELESPTNRMKIRTVNVPELSARKLDSGVVYDYKSYNEEKTRVIPLEWIVRYKIPVGSSIRRRIKNPQTLGFTFTEWPEQSLKLNKPIIECSTKYESEDRYMSDPEALRISGLSEAEFETMKDYTKRVGDIITRQCNEAGLDHEDGKVEFVYVDGKILLGDVAGTPDEDRFTKTGKPFSKEILRQYYKKNDKEWCDYVNASKRLAKERGIANWKDLCVTEPKKLPEELVNLVGEAYQAGANLYTGKEFFRTRPLDVVLGSIYSRFDV